MSRGGRHIAAQRGAFSLDERTLAPQEQRVASLVAQGRTNREISIAMNLTEGTVKEYMNRAFQKLNIGNRTALAIWALNHGAHT